MPANVWKGYIAFGLVSFPVRLSTAGRAEAVHFHLLHRKDLSRVKEVWYCAEENKPIERSDIVKGYEAGKGEYVVVEDKELKAVAPQTATTIDIVQFARSTAVDPIYFERSYYVSPGADISKPYELFLQALKESEHAAIGKMSMHGREHVVLIRAAGRNLILHTLFYPDELHQTHKRATPAKLSVTRKELELATEVISRLTAPFNPDQFHDTYRENVERLIEQKRKGQKITTESKPRRAPVVDLMDALKKSLKSSPASAKAKRGTRVA